jgi:hypothetical protein
LEIIIPGIAEAFHAATHADVVILVQGGTCHEEDGGDRAFLSLPGFQMDLFCAIYKVGKSITVVIINGGPYSSGELKECANVAIL